MTEQMQGQSSSQNNTTTFDNGGVFGRNYSDDSNDGTSAAVIDNLDGAEVTDVGWSILWQSEGLLLVGGAVTRSSQGFNAFIARYDTVSNAWDRSFQLSGGGNDLDYDSGDDQIRDVRLDSEGRIVAVGYVTDNSGRASVAIWRFLASGLLDPSFGSSGLTVVSSPTTNGCTGSEKEVGNSVSFLEDGKIVVAANLCTQTESYPTATVIRLNTDAKGQVHLYATGDVACGLASDF